MGVALNMASSAEVAEHVHEICVKQRDICQALLDKEKQSGGSGVQLLQKALLSAELALGLLRMKNVDKEKAFTQLLQKHVESVLDSTFHLENGLVDRDFPQDTCINEIKDIIAQINASIQFVQANIEISKVLDKDTIECLHWRPGALMYMYCCTVMNDAVRKKMANTDIILQQCCRVGVAHFQELFKVHSPVAEGEGFTTNDQNVAQQLQAGIRSDTHMLALAYGGELCYWYRQWTSDRSDNDSSMKMDTESSTDFGDFRSLLNTLCSSPTSIEEEVFDPVKVGTDFLTKYIEAAEGSVRLQSWSCERPKQILKEFNN